MKIHLKIYFVICNILVFSTYSDVFAQSSNQNCDHSSLMQVIRKNSLKKLNKFDSQNPNYDYKCVDKDGNTPLILAGGMGRNGGAYKSVPFLLEKGVDPNAVNKYGQTAYPLYAQYKYTREENNPRLKLVKAGANVHAVDHFGFNAAHYAALHHRNKVVWEISKEGVDLTKLTSSGSNLWDVAEYSGRVQGLQPSTRLGEKNLRYYNFLYLSLIHI